jgi:hypothetical protein
MVDEGDFDCVTTMDIANTYQGVLPLLVVLASENEFWLKSASLPSYFSPDDDSPIDNTPSDEKTSRPGHFRLLAVITISAAAALATRFTTTPTSTLGVSGAIFFAAGLVLFESALKTSKDDTDSGSRGLMSANGTFSRRNSMGGAQKEQQLASLRDVAAVTTMVCGIATYLMEPAIKSDAMTWEPLYRGLQGDWKTLHYHRTVQQVLLMTCVNAMANTLLFFMVSLSFHSSPYIGRLNMSFHVARLAFYLSEGRDANKLDSGTGRHIVYLSSNHHQLHTSLSIRPIFIMHLY